ncbi:MAG: cyclic nucleotide-binding domain-containing protein [Magnetococcus sp. MYC-9]
MLMLKLLNKIPFFANFSEDNKRMLAESDSFFTQYQAGDYLIREGTTDDTLLIVVRGTADVFRDARPEQILVTLSPGAVIGEVSFLTGRPRSSNVVAKEDVTCFSISRAALEEMEFAIQLQFKDELIGILIKHLDMANKTMSGKAPG